MTTATSARRDAVERLVEICDQPTWQPDLILRRGATPALLRAALRAACHDEDLLDEVRMLWPVASGQPEPLIDAALGGLPSLPAPAPTFDIADLEEALRG